MVIKRDFLYEFMILFSIFVANVLINLGKVRFEEVGTILGCV